MTELSFSCNFERRIAPFLTQGYKALLITDDGQEVIERVYMLNKCHTCPINVQTRMLTQGLNMYSEKSQT